jgi:hypothetical protein
MADPVLTEPADALEMLHDAETLDPLADAEEGVVKNRAKVGSARPSSLLYTYGPGAVMDLPGFSIMPAGLDDWEPIWKRRENIPTILEPRLLNASSRPPGRLPAPVPLATEEGPERHRGQRPRHPGPRLPPVVPLHGLRLPRAAPAIQLHQYPPVSSRPRAVQPQELPGPRRQARRIDQEQAAKPSGSRTASADLHQRAPRRVSLHAVGASRWDVSQGRIARSEDARRQRR